MSKKVNPTSVGIFVTGALIFMIAALFILGSGKLFETRGQFVIYFESSANGLSEGSDVLLGGVKVGSVVEMFVDFDPKTDTKVIPVVIDLSGDRIAALSPEARGKEEILSRESIEDAIDRGLRARLMSRSALTGQLYVDLEFIPDQSGYIFPSDPIDGLKQIPSVKNPIEQVLDKIAAGVEGIGASDIGGLIKHVDELVLNLDAKIAELDLKAISDNANRTINNIDKAVIEGDLKGAIANYDKALVGVTDLVDTLEAAKLNDVMDKAALAIEQFQAAGKNIARLTSPEAPLTTRLNRTLADIDSAARSFRELADFLKRNPNALVTGKKRP